MSKFYSPPKRKPNAKAKTVGKSRKTQKELEKHQKNSINCSSDCNKRIYHKTYQMSKKREKCLKEKEKKGANYKKCLKKVGIDLNNDYKLSRKCKKTKCANIHKKSRMYFKELTKQLSENKNINKKSNKSNKSNKCCKCCAGRYWGNSMKCNQGLYPCCKGVSTCKH